MTDRSASLVDPYRITTVCLGNICRSPMAEAVIHAQLADAGLADRVTVRSAGTDGWHIGEDADPRALATLRAAGYDLDHAGRQFDRDWFDPDHPDFGDLILTMDASNYAKVLGLAAGSPRSSAHESVRMMRSFDPALAGVPIGDPRLDVPDPWFTGGFDEVLAMLESASAGLVLQLPTLLATR